MRLTPPRRHRRAPILCAPPHFASENAGHSSNSDGSLQNTDTQSVASATSERLSERLTEVVNWAYRGKFERDEGLDQNGTSSLEFAQLRPTQKMLQAASENGPESRALLVAVQDGADGRRMRRHGADRAHEHDAAEIGLFSVDPDLQGSGIVARSSPRPSATLRRDGSFDGGSLRADHPVHTPGVVRAAWLR